MKIFRVTLITLALLLTTAVLDVLFLQRLTGQWTEFLLIAAIAILTALNVDMHRKERALDKAFFDRALHPSDFRR